MAYVAVKGGREGDHQRPQVARRGAPRRSDGGRDRDRQVREQLSLAVDRVMGEGSCYDRDPSPRWRSSSARGDLPEAVFLIRAYRTHLPRFWASEPLGYGEHGRAPSRLRLPSRTSRAARCSARRSTTPTACWTSPWPADGVERPQAVLAEEPQAYPMPTIGSVFAHEGLLETDERTPDAGEPFDLTREPMSFPADRDQRLQALARGDEASLRAWRILRSAAGATPTRSLRRDPDGRGGGRVRPTKSWASRSRSAEVTVTECQMVGGSKSFRRHPPTPVHCAATAWCSATERAQGDEHGHRRPALRDNAGGLWPSRSGAGRGVRPYHSDNVEASGLGPAPEVAALRGLPSRPAKHPPPAPRVLRTPGPEGSPPNERQ